MINNLEKKEMKFFLMIPRPHFPIHSIAYSACILKPFLRTYHTICLQMRDYINNLWERIESKGFTLHAASLAVPNRHH